MPADRIELRDLRILGRCGVLPEEEVRAQPLQVDLDVELDLSGAGASDDLEDTVDYGALCALVEGTITHRHVALLPARPLGTSTEDPGSQYVNYPHGTLALRIADSSAADPTDTSPCSSTWRR